MTTPPFSQDEIFRYARHLVIPEVGLAGQARLKQAAVLVVGTGGLGSPISLYLAAAGVGRIGLVDYDVVDSSNLQRQIVHDSTTVGQAKVASARRHLQSLNPLIQVDTYNTVFNAKNARDIAQGYDVLVDGTDNFPTRYLLNDLAMLTGRPYVYGSIFRFEGQASVFDGRTGPCYRCLFPEPPPPWSVPSCTAGGVFGVLPGVIGSVQATETLKIILGVGEPLIGRLLLYDALEMSFQIVRLRKNPACPICGSTPTITDLRDYAQFCGTPLPGEAEEVLSPDWELTPAELVQQLKTAAPPLLVDVRQPMEQQIARIAGAVSLPLEELPTRYTELPTTLPLVLICRTGIRGARAVHFLRDHGYTKAVRLVGGINAYAQTVDPTLFQY
ncbi:MAG TPA: molybdopterin-synthase adenylyltransferase MoeB [Anaerolineaceae bacterium]|nr:molybdopterin-synthase adenylyltransferase MoeB [Anaerolineaceae bacterium]